MLVPCLFKTMSEFCNKKVFLVAETISLKIICNSKFFFFYVKTNLSTHGGFEPVTYRKECLNKAPIHRQSKAP